ncbi:hypothetical protein CR513_19989, partial [Mucuna pruriens]
MRDFKDTFYVDSSSRNLIFVSCLDKLGFSFTFGERKINLMLKSQIIGYGSLVDDQKKGVARSFDLLVIIHTKISDPLIPTICDNNVVLFYVKINKTSSGFKHLKVKYLIVRDLVKVDFIMVEHIDTNSIIVDPLINRLKHVVFKRHGENMDIVSYYDVLG